MIETDIWEPNPDKPGYLRKVRQRTIREVYDDLREILKEEDLIDEYFEISTTIKYDMDRQGNVDFPEYHNIACYCVTGSNEGHYIHIDAMLSSNDPLYGRYLPLFLGKTFQGREHAQKIASLCSTLLDEW